MQNVTANAHPGPAHDSYEALKDHTGPLNTSTAVISTKYLCQVPKRKSTGTLLLSILVADLVFMQALWKMFELCTVAWLAHKDPKGRKRSSVRVDEAQRLMLVVIANYCSGCGGQTNIPLASLGPKTHKRKLSPSFKANIVRKRMRYGRLEPLSSLNDIARGQSGIRRD